MLISVAGTLQKMSKSKKIDEPEMPVLVEETLGAEKAKKPGKRAPASQTVTNAKTSEPPDDEHYEEEQGQY